MRTRFARLATWIVCLLVLAGVVYAFQRPFREYPSVEYGEFPLPPGWQKKLKPFPPELVRQLPPPPPNCERGYINGVAVVYDRTTRVIRDSIDLIGAVTGH